MATTPQTNATLGQIADVIRAHDTFALCGHVSPDGDCLGSQLALWHVLRALGKEATCLLVRDEPVPASVAFMPGMDEMVPASRFEGEVDVFVGLDVPLRERIGQDACRVLDGAATSITVDHHASETTMCEYVHVDPDAASASMLVWELAKLLVSEPPAETALCAYTGLVTDTGGFRFQNSDERAFQAACELVGYGVDAADVAAHAFQSRTLASLKLESLAIGRMRLLCEGQVALSWVSSDDMSDLGAVKSDAEPIIDALRSVHGVRIACILREQDGHIRGSLRSKDATDVSTLARQLNGGGHRGAAGLTLHMPLPDAVLLLEDKLAQLAEGCLEA